MKADGAAEVQALKGDWAGHKHQLDALLHSQDSKLQRVDKAERIVESLEKSYGDLEKRFY